MFGTQSISEREAVISELDEISDRYGYPYVTGVMDYYKVTNLSEESITDEQLIAYRDMVVSKREPRNKFLNKIGGGQYEVKQACT